MYENQTSIHFSVNFLSNNFYIYISRRLLIFLINETDKDKNTKGIFHNLATYKCLITHMLSHNR